MGSPYVLAAFDAASGELLWGRAFGSGSGEVPYDVHADGERVFAGGFAAGPIDFGEGVSTPTPTTRILGLDFAFEPEDDAP